MVSKGSMTLAPGGPQLPDRGSERQTRRCRWFCRLLLGGKKKASR